MPDKPQDDSRMALWEHLDDLRGGIIRSLVALFVGILVTYNFAEPIMKFLQQPLLDVLPVGEQKLYFTGIADKFFTYIKVSMLAALALVSPYLLFELWKFVSPALYRNEKKMVIPFIFFGTLSFLTGLAFAYYVVLPFSYDFLINFGNETDTAIITLTSYFSFTLRLVLGIGILFEMPVVMILLAFLGILEAPVLIQYRRHAIIGMLVLAAVITPSPDVMTMMIVVAPLLALYELSILGVKIVNRKNASN